MSEITNTEELLKKCENLPKKYVTITDLRYVLDLYNNDEISFSRMVEILNENVEERINNNSKKNL